MEKKVIRSGAPYVTAGLAVLLYALTAGIGSLPSYVFAAAALAGGYLLGKKAFPDRVVEVERAPRSGNAEADALIAEARVQLAKIEAANDAIAEAALSAQIDDIAATCRQILARLEEQPQMLDSLRTFLRYYLPAVMKLLDARAALEGEIGRSENAQIADRIRTAMAEVQSAFRRQLEALNEYRFINLESEMDVLADMLRADGLMPDDAQAVPANAPQQGAQEEDDPFASVFHP